MNKKELQKSLRKTLSHVGAIESRQRHEAFMLRKDEEYAEWLEGQEGSREWMPRHLVPVLPLSLLREPSGKVHPGAVVLRAGKPYLFILRDAAGTMFTMPATTLYHHFEADVDLTGWLPPHLPSVENAPGNVPLPSDDGL